MEIQNRIQLSGLTTIELGGNAEYFAECRNPGEIVSALQFADDRKIPFQIFSGGSNIIFPDEGYNGIVIRIMNKGISFTEVDEIVFADVAAGEKWDDFVKVCIEKNLAGVECLSGIPGSVGATPIQNVGAYGQEVKDVIDSVTVMDTLTKEIFSFSNSECRFEYRNSRFKSDDADRFIVTEVKFAFRKNMEPVVSYVELAKYISENQTGYDSADCNTKLFYIRESVLKLRKKKSMIIDNSDPNTKSCGSFFKNPIVSKSILDSLRSEYPSIPCFRYKDKYKISAAWLIETAGFHKGYTDNGVGISENHSLALINKGGSTTSLLSLAKEIETKVNERFGIELEKEPVVVKQ